MWGNGSFEENIPCGEELRGTSPESRSEKRARATSVNA